MQDAPFIDDWAYAWSVDFVLTAVLWLFYDRYVLPLVAIVAALRLGTVGIQRPRLALVSVAMFAIIGGVGTWDERGRSRALDHQRRAAPLRHRQPRSPGARVRHVVTCRRSLAPSGRIYVIDQMPRSR